MYDVILPSGVLRKANVFGAVPSEKRLSDIGISFTSAFFLGSGKKGEQKQYNLKRLEGENKGAKLTANNNKKHTCWRACKMAINI